MSKSGKTVDGQPPSGSKDNKSVQQFGVADGERVRVAGDPGGQIGATGLPGGLFLAGVVFDRRREWLEIGQAKEKREKITYKIDIGGTQIAVDEFAPKTYYGVGEQVCLPVIVRCFTRRGGVAAYGLTVKSANAERGEEF